MKKIVIIGSNHAGLAAINVIVNSGIEAELVVFDKNSNVYKNFEKEEGVKVASTAEELMQNCDYIVMSIKPQFYQVVGDEIKSSIKHNQIIITVAPSYTLADMANLLGEDVKVVRTMPNTPAMVFEGMTAVCFGSNNFTEAEKQLVKDLFESVGRMVELPERLMDAAIVANGSSPAFIYLYAK